MDARHKSKLMNARQGTALQAATLSIRRRRGWWKPPSRQMQRYAEMQLHIQIQIQIQIQLATCHKFRLLISNWDTVCGKLQAQLGRPQKFEVFAKVLTAICVYQHWRQQCVPRHVAVLPPPLPLCLWLCRVPLNATLRYNCADNKLLNNETKSAGK